MKQCVSFAVEVEASDKVALPTLPRLAVTNQQEQEPQGQGLKPKAEPQERQGGRRSL